MSYMNSITHLTIPVQTVMNSLRTLNSTPIKAQAMNMDLANKLIEISISQKVMAPDLGKYVDFYF